MNCKRYAPVVTMISLNNISDFYVFHEFPYEFHGIKAQTPDPRVDSNGSN